jgi:hypothetical protein
VTILEGDKTAPVVYVQGGALPTAVDGFTIRPADTGAPVESVIGIQARDAVITVANNTLRVTANAVDLTNCVSMVLYNDIAATSSNWSSGISTSLGGTGYVVGNTVSGYPQGIICNDGPYLIHGNIVSGLGLNPNANVTGIGLYESLYEDYPMSQVSNNVVSGMRGASVAGIRLVTGDMRVVNNLVVDGHTTGVAYGILVERPDAGTVITDNTVVDITGAVDDSRGLRLGDDYPYTQPTVANNILAFNTTGLSTSMTAPLLSGNIFYGNARYDYWRYDHGEVPPNSLFVDPLFVNRAGGDYHLGASSPAINAGDNSVVMADDWDMDWQPRIGGGRVDIGADEYYAVAPPLPDPVRALRIAGGLETAGPDDAAGGLSFPLDIVDAVRAARHP